MEPLAKRRKTGSPACRVISPSESDGHDPHASPSVETPPNTSHCFTKGSVCFGKLIIPIMVNKQLPCSKQCASVKIREHDQIVSVTSNDLLGTIRRRDAQLFELFKNERIETEMMLSPQHSSAETKGERLKLTAILYGDRALRDSLREVLQGQTLYLQDPIGATHDIIYQNPHRYFNPPGARTSDFWATVQEPETTEEKISYPDPLAAFTSGCDLDETEASSYIQTPLKPHQKQALTFMRNRERGWNLNQPNADLWSLKQNDCVTVAEYVNNVDGSSHYSSPLDFRGGIIADSMGSGKTLTMIALIAHDKPGIANRPDESTAHGITTTLVIVPPSLLDNWQSELSSHLSNETFSWRPHHGRSKISNVQELKDIDILLTTYPTAATEWRTKRTESVIFLHHWHRVILDEAHWIKNRSSVCTKAAYHIESSRRWAVTGTPIQNRLPELQSILCFIRAYPYSDAETFDDHIKHEWASGGGQEAVSRLKRLLGFLMLRRSDSTILPHRTDVKKIVELDPHERQAYREAAARTVSYIDSALEGTSLGNGFMNPLVKINTLRLICTLGHASIGSDPEPLHNSTDTGEAVWNMAAGRRALEQFPMLERDTIFGTLNQVPPPMVFRVF
ncbi:hypothetical protein FALCPG4_007782 [Fusarium falciforme]